MTDESLIFEGLKVLDVGSWIAGPQPLTSITPGRWMRETNDLCRLI